MVNMLLKNTVTGVQAKVLDMKHSKEGFWHEEQQGQDYTKYNVCIESAQKWACNYLIRGFNSL